MLDFEWRDDENDENIKHVTIKQQRTEQGLTTEVSAHFKLSGVGLLFAGQEFFGQIGITGGATIVPMPNTDEDLDNAGACDVCFPLPERPE